MPSRDAYDAWLGAFVEGLEWYGIRPDEAGPLAEFMLAALEGALVLTRVRQSTEPLARVARQVSTVVLAAAGA